MKKHIERRIRNIEDLKKVIKTIELDEGIRIYGEIPGFEHGGFIFITKTSNKYCVNICDRIYDRKLEDYIPGGKEDFFPFNTPEEVYEFIKTRISQPLIAWYY